jgi:hypothetical protein
MQRGDSHDEAKEAAEHEEHLTHVHQLQNNGPWAALVACIFFMLYMGVLAFYAIQQVAQAGWSPVCLEYAGDYGLFAIWF